MARTKAVVTRKEAAVMLGRSESTVTRYVLAGRLTRAEGPAGSSPQQNFFRAADVRALAKALAGEARENGKRAKAERR